MAEQYQINGVLFTLGATFPAKTGIGQSLNYFFTGLSPGATYYFAVSAYNNLGFSGHDGPVSLYVPDNLSLFGIETTRPQIGTTQPNWFRNSAFSMSINLGYYWWRELFGANLGNTGEIIYEDAMLLGAVGPNPQFNAGSIIPYNYSNPTGADPDWKIQHDPNLLYLRKEGATEEQRFQNAYAEFVGPTAQVQAYKKYDLDIVWIDLQNAYGNPLIWRSNVLPLGMSGVTQAYSKILLRCPNTDLVNPLIDAFHAENFKVMGYFKPLFNYLSVEHYPPAKTINGAYVKYLRYSCFGRSIFNENYKNYIKNLMVEVVSPKASGGLEIDGVQWDYSFCTDEYIDFSESALDVWAKSLGYANSQDSEYIKWAEGMQNFPFPNESLTTAVLRPNGSATTWLYSYSDKEGTSLSDLVNAPDEVITQTQKANLIAYANVLINRYNEILNELAEAVYSASNGNGIFLPASEHNSWMERADISFNHNVSKYTQGLKTEFVIEPRGYHRQRPRNVFYTPNDYITLPCGGGTIGIPAIGCLEGTSSSEKVYADINRPDTSITMNLDQKCDYAGGNKTAFSWHETRVGPLPTGLTGYPNDNNQFDTTYYRKYPTGYPLSFGYLGGEDSINGYLRGIYQYCVKNSVIMDMSAFGNDGWVGELSVRGTGDTAYYINYGDSPQPKLPFWRKAAYHQKKIKQQMQNTGLTFAQRDLYAWAAVHMSDRGKQGIQSSIQYIGDFAIKRINPDGSTGDGLKYVKQCQMQDPFGTNNKYSNGSYTWRKNSLNQNWGEFYWPVIGAMLTMEKYFVPYSMIFDDHLLNMSDLEGFKVIIIPHKEWLLNEQKEVLERFKRLGGSVIYMEDVFANVSYDIGDPRLKGRFYDLTDQQSEIDKLFTGITMAAGYPPFYGNVTHYEFEGMSFPFSDKYKNKQCAWYKYSEPNENGEFTIGAHLLNDMIWMDNRRYGSYDEARFSEIEPSSSAFRDFGGLTPGLNGIMDYDLFGYGPDWRTTWYNTQASDPSLFDNVPWPLPDPDGTTAGPSGDSRYWYEPHPRNMWGNPLVGGYTGGTAGYWSANLNLSLPTNYEILQAYKIYVNQENEPNDIGKTDLVGFTYDSPNQKWTIGVTGIGMHAFLALKVRKNNV